MRSRRPSPLKSAARTSVTRAIRSMMAVVLQNHHRADLVVAREELAHAGHQYVQVAVLIDIDGAHVGRRRKHGADPCLRVDTRGKLPYPGDAVGQHVRHQNIRQSVFVEIDNLHAANPGRRGGRGPDRLGRQKVDLLPVLDLVRPCVALRLAGALENVLEHLPHGEPGVVGLVEQHHERHTQHDGGDAEARHKRGASFPRRCWPFLLHPSSLSYPAKKQIIPAVASHTNAPGGSAPTMARLRRGAPSSQP